MENSKVLTGLVAFTLLLSLVNLYSTFTLSKQFDTFVNNEFSTKKVAQKDNQPTPQPQPAAAEDKRYNVSIDDDAVKGDDKAPVTIVEFSDFECPFCAKFYRETLPKITEEYINTGKVKLVYRDLPLPMHKNAPKAAEAAECAGEQGKYYEMHDILFENYRKLTPDLLPEYAKQAGLNIAQFNSCLDNGDMEAEVKNDVKDANALGLSGAPAFFINGRLIKGAYPFETFKKVIDEELFKK